MAKVLLAVVSARHREHWRQAIRDTWKPLVKGAEVLFFVGRGEPYAFHEDVIQLDCDDSYFGLPSKVLAIANWARVRFYDFILKIDDDTVINPELLLRSGFDSYPYSGRPNRKPTFTTPFWVPTGFCYWMNRQCMEHLSVEPLPKNNDDEFWVANCLYNHGIMLSHDRRYRLHTGEFPTDGPKRALRLPKDAPVVDSAPAVGEFAWAIYLESGANPRIPDPVKLEEFHKVFNRYVKVKQ